MKESELFRRIMAGELLVVGEYRGGKALASSFVDRKTGAAITRVFLHYVVECNIAGCMPVMKVIAPVPADVTDPEAVTITLQKGKRYAFPIVSLSREHDIVTARLALVEPEEIEPD